MYKPTFGLLVLFALSSPIVAIPEPVLDSVKINELEKRSVWIYGKGHLYSPTQEASHACGPIYYADTDLVVAIPPNFFDFTDHCERSIQIQAVDSHVQPIGEPVTAIIVDQCDTVCIPNDLNDLGMSPGLWFNEFQVPPGTAGIDILWSF